MKREKGPSLIIPVGVEIVPEEFELSAAKILARLFERDVEFLPVTSSKTPDVIIGNVRWEIKSPTGKGKNNIHRQFSRAMRQSNNIVIDARRSKDDIRRIRNKLKLEARIARTLNRLILITKDGKVEVIK